MTVSALRTLVIGSPSSIYGVSPVQPMLRWPTAEPEEVLDYSVNVAAPLADVAADLDEVQISVAPSGAGELAAFNLLVDDDNDRITVWLAGGVAGRDYKIKVLATTNLDHEFEWVVGLRIDQTLGTFPAVAPPSLAFGAVLIWPSGTGVPDGVILGFDGAGLIGSDGSYLTFA